MARLHLMISLEATMPCNSIPPALDMLFKDMAKEALRDAMLRTIEARRERKILPFTHNRAQREDRVTSLTSLNEGA